MNNICIELLNSFTEKELAGFKKFLNSGFFYADKKISILFKELKKYAYNKKVFNHYTEVKVYNAVFNKSIMTQKLNVKQKKTAKFINDYFY